MFSWHCHFIRTHCISMPRELPCLKKGKGKKFFFLSPWKKYRLPLSKWQNDIILKIMIKYPPFQLSLNWVNQASLPNFILKFSDVSSFPNGEHFFFSEILVVHFIQFISRPISKAQAAKMVLVLFLTLQECFHKRFCG